MMHWNETLGYLLVFTAVGSMQNIILQIHEILESKKQRHKINNVVISTRHIQKNKHAAHPMQY